MATTETQFRLTREIVVLGGVVLIGMILAVLDATIVNVALPTLGRDFHTSISTIQWVPTIYLLAFASVIPVTGWASERFGATSWRWIFFVNLPVGALALLLAVRLLPAVPPRRQARLDLLGVGLLSG